MASTSGHVKTCQNCARGKIRCIRTSDSSICDRCRRLDKECYFRAARPRYNPAKKGTRVEALEAKVDQLLARVVNSQHTEHQPDVPLALSDPELHSIPDKPRDVIDRGIVRFDDAVTLLESFRETLMPCFPFIFIAPEVTLAQLRAEKPLLLLAILKVSSYKNAAAQQILEETFQTAVADQMIFTHNPSMDVLLGLLVALAWLQHQSQHERFSSYLHLAWSIVGDLRLDRLSETQSFYSRMAMSKDSSDENSSRHSVNEGRRALIGCYVLSSCRSTILQMDRMMTRLLYVEKHALELLSNAEIASDRCVIQLVKLQQIFERIDDAVVTTANPVREVDMHAFQTEINEYRTTLPATFSDNSNYSASSAPRSHADSGLPPHLQSGHQPLDLSPFQVEFLNRGMTEAKKFFDYVFTLAPDTYRLLSYTQWLQTGFNVVLSCKLAVTGAKYAPRSPHVRALCSDLNMPHVLRAVLQRMQGLSKDRATVDGKQHSKYFYEERLSHILEWFEQKYHLVPSEDTTQISTGLPDGGPSTLANSATSQDVPLMGENYGATQVAQVDDTALWPDFLWNISTDDILNGYMGFPDMPYPTLQPGYDVPLP
ncbi:Fungal transcriptional regulatory protein, N-terminal [Penicillium camemberti]|uniref:Fungal transcriptional regulatory protein, N-terminal n=1 Tax=Penicillium camemberti (strain FM 013) TaxID=1429867 RepID=A0A0G4NVF8_PENC3|nr:Fungal transcriptional regulatory protein, N-terminal [Penicillium camemberti]